MACLVFFLFFACFPGWSDGHQHFCKRAKGAAVFGQALFLRLGISAQQQLEALHIYLLETREEAGHHGWLGLLDVGF